MGALHRRNQSIDVSNIDDSRSSTPKSISPQSINQSSTNESAIQSINRSINQYSPEVLYVTRSYSTVDPLCAALAKRLSNFTGVLDTRNRRLVKDDDVIRQGRFSTVKRKLFLFTDLLILTKQSINGKLKVKSTADLDDLYIDARSINHQSIKTKLPNVFRIIFTTPVKGEWIISVQNQSIYNEWISAIALACSRVKYAKYANNQSINQSINEKLPWGWYLHFVHGTIHLAALQNDLEGVKDALEMDNQSINRRGQEGRTALHIAAFMNHSSIIDLLIDRGCDVTIRDPAGRTAVHIAAQLGYIASIDCLLACPSIKPSLYHTISTSQSTSVNLSTTSALWLCALSRNGEYEKCLRSLVRHCIKNDDVIASEILDLRSCDNLTLLEACVVLNLADLVPCLVGLGCTLDLESDDGCTPLSVAAQHGSTEIVSTLIQLGAQVNWRDAVHLNSALHFAATLEIASYCVANGARLSLRNREGVRVTDIYATSSAYTTLTSAAQLYESRVPVEINQSVQPRPNNVANNGGHGLDTCAVCEDSLIGLGSIGRKRDWCRCCGFVMCSPCLNQSAVFVDSANDSEMTAKVCAGCFNRSLYAPETYEKKKKRIARQRAAALEAANSMWTLEGLTQALTAVHVQPTSDIQQTPIPVPNVIIEQQKKRQSNVHKQSRLQVNHDQSSNQSQSSPRASPRNAQQNNIRSSQSLETLSLNQQINQSNNQSNHQSINDESPNMKPLKKRAPVPVRKRTSSPSG